MMKRFFYTFRSFNIIENEIFKKIILKLCVRVCVCCRIRKGLLRNLIVKKKFHFFS